MAAGFKDFVAGNVLSESDLDDYLMRQTVMQFASAAARDSALAGVTREGMYADLADVNALSRCQAAGSWTIIYQDNTAFTPSWTNLAIGNGTNSFQYGRAGPMVILTGRLTFGSSTSISGSVMCSLPLNANGAATGSCRYVDSSDSNKGYPGTCYQTGGTTLNFTTTIEVTNVNSESPVIAGTPFTWATGDFLDFTFVYMV